MAISSDFKLIWVYLKDRKKEFYRNCFLAIFVSFLLAASPYFYGKLVDIVKIEPSDINIIFAIFSVWFLISLMSIIFNRIVGRRADFLGVDLYMEVVNRFSIHLLRMPLSFHREKKMGEILSRVEKAADSLLGIVNNVLFWTIPRFITAFMGIAFLFFIEWRLAFAAVIFLFFYTFITIYKTNPIIKYQKELQQNFEKAYGNLYDAVLNVHSVKSNTAEEFEDEKIRAGYDKAKVAFKYFMSLWQSMAFWQNFFSTMGFITVFALAIILLRAGEISIGKLVMFVGYFNLIQGPLQNLSWNWRVYKTGITTIKRVNAVLDISQEDYNKGGIILENLKGKVEFKNVYFRYKGKKNTLEDINFVVLPGQKIALVGGSGEGKTTLVDLLSLYFKPSKGNIYIDGREIRKINLKFLRENIAYVPQEIMLFNDTVFNNIKFGNPLASEAQVIGAAKTANAHDFIMGFSKKYQQMVGERGIKLSAGQKQRLAIARALIRNPKILILDEATSALDSKTEKLVHEAMEKLFSGRTVFIIAHRLSTIKSADRILVLKKKKVAEEGTHEELLKSKGDYFEFHSIQNKS